MRKVLVCYLKKFGLGLEGNRELWRFFFVVVFVVVLGSSFRTMALAAL